MKKVQILLSTYNGEKYIKEQLNSILQQDYPNIFLLIRDDGSSDSTLDIIKEYTSKDERVCFYRGQNLGVRDSFFDLMQQADPTMDYYALSDQDDVWKANKISRAVNKLESYDSIPTLYCGRTELVSYDLKPLVSTIKKANINPDFGNALVENIAVGCTCVFNHSLLSMVKSHIPEFTVMHDWWLYLSASAFGQVIYDDEAYILYRQHDNNIIGSKATYYDEFKNRLKNYHRNRGQIRKQLKEFQRLYELDSERFELMTLVLEADKRLLNRLRIIYGNDIYRQRSLDNFIFKLLFLLGKI